MRGRPDFVVDFTARKADPRREAVYAAERAVGLPSREPMSYSRAARWLRRLIASPVMQARYGVWQVVLEKLPPLSRPMAGLAGGAPRTAWIQLPGLGVTKGVVVHELAHPLADAVGAYGHDATFIRVHLDLVGLVFGADTEHALRLALVSLDAIATPQGAYGPLL